MQPKKGEEVVKAWHWVADNGRLNFEDKRKVVVGKTMTMKGPLKPSLCSRGMHGSERVIDALYFAPGGMLCRVEIWGDLQKSNDKLCGRHRKVLWALTPRQTQKILKLWILDCAEALLDKFPKEPKAKDLIRKAIDVIKLKQTDEELAKKLEREFFRVSNSELENILINLQWLCEGQVLLPKHITSIPDEEELFLNRIRKVVRRKNL